MSELPSASTTTPPPAATAAIGHGVSDTRGDGIRLAGEELVRAGAGMLVTRRRSCGRSGPPSGDCGGLGCRGVLMFASVRRRARRAALAALYNLE